MFIGLQFNNLNILRIVRLWIMLIEFKQKYPTYFMIFALHLSHICVDKIAGCLYIYYWQISWQCQRLFTFLLGRIASLGFAVQLWIPVVICWQTNKKKKNKKKPSSPSEPDTGASTPTSGAAAATATTSAASSPSVKKAQPASNGITISASSSSSSNHKPALPNGDLHDVDGKVHSLQPQYKFCVPGTSV